MDVYYLRGGAPHDKTVFVEGAEAKHILKVRRQGVGDELSFTDGKGHFLHATIDRCSANDLHAVVQRSEDDPREVGAPRVTLCMALLKGDHFELALEKAVELGVHRVVPLLAERCIVRWKGGDKKLGRWRRIAQSAMKQSGRSWMPLVEEPAKLSELAGLLEEDTVWVVGDEEETRRGVAELKLGLKSRYAALVGPEGGLSPAEKGWLAQQGAHAVTLSPYRLRAETAAISLLAALSSAAVPGS